MEREFDPKLTWNSSRDDIINEFYKPALSNCVLYQRLSGYFSSSTFANVANEILDFIRSKSKIQLITSPNLSDTDKQLFEQSVLEGEKLLSTIFLDDLENDPDNLKLAFTKLMSYMLTNNIDGKPQLEIKIAIPNTGPGLFHQKIGILKYENGEKIAFNGSVNETGMGWYENIENFSVFRSWGDDTNSQGVVDNQRDFNDLWNDNNEEVRIYNLPQAVKEHLLKIRPESDKEVEETIQKVRELVRNKPIKNIPEPPSHEKAAKIELREYQVTAIDKWIKNNFCGLLEHATALGKTYTAFGCIHEIQKSHERTAVIIACPQLHLVEQWKNEIEKYNSEVAESEKLVIAPQITCNSDFPNWDRAFERILYNFNTAPLGTNQYIANHIIIFTAHKTLGLPKFTERILKIKDAKKFLIVDEVHNISPESSKNTLLPDYDFRLGLSATPYRHLDDEGTDILKDYFHGIVDTLDLKKAIHELNVLCHYDYFPYYVSLTSDEMDVYQSLTAQIAALEQKKKKGYKLTDKDRYPYLARYHLVANAENKDRKLEEILSVEFNDRLDLTLIYCTSFPSPSALPDSPTQLERVKKILADKGISSDSVTYRDKTGLRLHILDLLAKGHLDAVTAVNCLDEGVNVPVVQTGIFMASSGNPRQFIQRRGRLLRKSDETNKEHAYIYDILVTPPIPAQDPEFNLSERKLIAKELLRHKEFAEIADNEKDAIKRIKEITEIFKIDFKRLTYAYIRDEMS